MQTAMVHLHQMPDVSQQVLNRIAALITHRGSA